MKKLGFILLLSTFCTISIFAQDPFFSNYRTAPLELNPALTGAINKNKWRVNLKYRDQWGTFLPGEGGFQTAYVSLDMRQCLSNNDFVGIGGSFMHDRSGHSPLNRTLGTFSAAYHKKLNKQTYLVAGGEVGFLQYALDNGNFTYDEQFDNPDSPGEISGGLNAHLFTGGAGLYFVWAEKKRTGQSFRAGLSARHLNRPELEFINVNALETPQLLPQIKGHVSYVFPLKPNTSKRLAFESYTFLIFQKPHKQLLLGGNILADVTERGKDVILHFGPAIRLVDNIPNGVGIEAVVLSLLLDFPNMTLGFNFDLNTSQLTQVSNGVGAFEFSYAYRIPSKKCDLVICYW